MSTRIAVAASILVSLVAGLTYRATPA